MVTKNILLLRANNINVLLRTIPLRHLYDNLTKMISYVKSLNSKLFYTSYITKSNCYDKQNDRLDVKQLIDFETQIDQALNYEKSGRIFEDTYLSCSALRSSYFINNKGFILPCPLGITPHKSIIDNDFLETFLSLGTEFKNLEKQNPCY